jgi:hypothetical protein
LLLRRRDGRRKRQETVLEDGRWKMEYGKGNLSREAFGKKNGKWEE